MRTAEGCDIGGIHACRADLFQKERPGSGRNPADAVCVAHGYRPGRVLVCSQREGHIVALPSICIGLKLSAH